MDSRVLAANLKYGPESAKMTRNSAYIMAEMWNGIANHFNGYLGNLVELYDRAYSRDATTHSVVLSMFWWGLFGREYGPQLSRGEADLLFDIQQGVALSLVMDTTAAHIPKDVQQALKAHDFNGGPQFLNKAIREDLGTDVLRVTTSWISRDLMIGGEELTESVNRGNQFVPAVVHWADHKPYPSASNIKAVAGSKLAISYPNATQESADIFTFALSGVPPSWNLAGNVVTGFDSLPCLDVEVDAPGLKALPVT